MPDKLPGLLTPTVAAGNPETQVIAQQQGEAHAEPPRRRMEMQSSELTPDKVPANAPWWYHVAVNASFASVMTLAFLYFLWRQPSQSDIHRAQVEAATTTERLIDRTLSGIDRMQDRQEKVVERTERANTEIRDIFRQRSLKDAERADKFAGQLEEMLTNAQKFHDAGKLERQQLKMTMDEVARIMGTFKK